MCIIPSNATVFNSTNWDGNTAFYNTSINKGDSGIYSGVYTDNFDDGTEDFIETSVTGTVVNGEYVISQALNTYGVSLFNNSNLTNYTAIVKSRYAGIASGGMIGGIGRAINDTDYYTLINREWNNDFQILRRGLGGSATLYDSGSIASTLGENYTYKYIHNGSYMAFYQDDVFLGSTSDSNSLSGKFGFLLQKSGGGTIYAYLDDIRIFNNDLNGDAITNGYSLHWSDEGAGYATRSFVINMSGTAFNYTVEYGENASNSWTQIGGYYTTDSATPSITGTIYQNTDIRITQYGNETQTQYIQSVEFVREATSVAPTFTSTSENATSYEYETDVFTANLSQSCNVSGLVNGVELWTNTSVTIFAYSNSTAMNGTHNITAIISNANGSAQYSWEQLKLLNSFDIFVHNKTQTLEWFTLSNYTAGMFEDAYPPFSFIWTNRSWASGYTAEIFFANGTSTGAINQTAVDGNTILSYPLGLFPGGTYYILETPIYTAPTLDNIVPFPPYYSFVGQNVTFNATSDQNSSNEFLLNGTHQLWSNGTSPTYTNTTAAIGDWNVSLMAYNTSNSSLSNQTTWLWNVSVLQPPQSLTNISDLDHIHFDWDDYESADYWNISRLDVTIPFTNGIVILDGIKDACYDCCCAYGFVGDSPNPYTTLGKEEIYITRNDTYLIIYADGEDNDNFNNDDNFIIGIDASNNNLSTDDRKFILNENEGVTAKRMSETGTWLYQATTAQGKVVGGGTAGLIQYEVFIPISELNINFTNGSTVKLFMSRTHTGSNPDIESYYPSTLINTTDATLWQSVLLSSEAQYIYVDNTSTSDYTVTGLEPFTWEQYQFVTINQTLESSAVDQAVITLDNPTYSVEGYIKDIWDNVISGADVWGQNGYPLAHNTSNASGYYTISHFHNGSYNIWANATGYYINSTPVTVAGANLTNVNITLTARDTWYYSTDRTLIGRINSFGLITWISDQPDTINDINVTDLAGFRVVVS